MYVKGLFSGLNEVMNAKYKTKQLMHFFFFFCLWDNYLEFKAIALVSAKIGLCNSIQQLFASLKTKNNLANFCWVFSYVTSLALKLESCIPSNCICQNAGQMFIFPVLELSLCFIYLASTRHSVYCVMIMIYF